MAELKMVVFDVDGTLIDSIAHIEAAMSGAFEACDLPAPKPGAVRDLVGISLIGLLDRLQPGLSDAQLNALAEAYKDRFSSMRASTRVSDTAPLFDGALDALERLSRRDDTLLGIATGKSRRGLDYLLDGHGLRDYFVTAQVADDHPSKPHPAMLEAALRETGVDKKDAVIVGDTSYDMQMGRSAGVATIGVEWGNHPTDQLTPLADHILADFAQIDSALDQLWGGVRG
ncbi:HAD-IA family hydrolase [Litoreibacter roseus]|uniref:Haloacid dehalogenase n=1 Tax=Litoreibacter roseus TaxID=2601869 RepID=A0A6N6JIX4_9RHOB|nr:HAD-IA family hydrolase [Litoreibacter roseus]GFE65142.1 haloacid dehalogenase [Litoreibacter roseus]